MSKTNISGKSVLDAISLVMADIATNEIELEKAERRMVESATDDAAYREAKNEANNCRDDLDELRQRLTILHRNCLERQEADRQRRHSKAAARLATLREHRKEHARRVESECDRIQSEAAAQTEALRQELAHVDADVVQ